MKIPANEQERLSALYEYNILDTLPEEHYDNITKLATEICNTPIALVSLVDEARQWFKSKQGLPAQMTDTSREQAFCSYAILQPDEMMLIPDAREDERFADSPLVTGPTNINFYAGVPLVTQKGYPVGTLCIIDHKPKEMTDSQKEALKILAKQVVQLLELHKRNQELERSRLQLENVNKELEKFAQAVAKDIKSPLGNIMQLSDILLGNYKLKLDAEGQQMLSTIKHSSVRLKKLTDDILNHASKAYAIEEAKQQFDFKELVQGIFDSNSKNANTSVKIVAADKNVYAYKDIVAQVLDLLIDNAITHNDKDKKIIEVKLTQDKWHYTIAITDNGNGIPFLDLRKIFDLFYVGDEKKTDSHSGLGLTTVKQLVEKLDGKVDVLSDEGNGSTFTFTVRR
jgi:Signal transduction histidine kinase